VAIVMVLPRLAPLLINFDLAAAIVRKNHITHNQISSLFWLIDAIGIPVAAFGCV
jgi:hypothetical protein